MAIFLASVIIAFACSINFLFRLKKSIYFFIFLSCYCLSNLFCNPFFNQCSSFWIGQEHVYLSLETTWSQFSSFLIFHPYLITLGFKTMWLKNKKYRYDIYSIFRGFLIIFDTKIRFIPNGICTFKLRLNHKKYSYWCCVT